MFEKTPSLDVMKILWVRYISNGLVTLQLSVTNLSVII
jgi:hypothetical protein